MDLTLKDEDRKKVIADIKDWSLKAKLAPTDTITLSMTIRKGKYVGGQLKVDFPR